MKKKLSVLLGLTLAATAALAGCGSSGTTSESTTAASSDSLWESIQSSGKIVVGTETAYSPYAYRDTDGNLTGFDVEVAEAIYGKMGLEIEWMDTGWDSLIASLDANKCDVVMDQIAITEERQEKYIFSEPYTYTYGGLLTTKDSGITSLEDIEGKKCAETATSNWNALVQELGGEIVETTGFQNSVQLVEQGRAEALVIENLTELDYLNNNPDSKLVIVDTTDEPVLTAVMMRQGSDQLQTEINKAIKELQEDGTLAEISEKYFGEDVTTEQ